MPEQKDELALTGPGGFSFKALGTNVVPLLTLLMVTVMLYGGYKHDADAATMNANIVSVIKEQTQVQRETLNAQREANCLARLTPEQRKRFDEIEFCRQLGKGR